MGKGDRGGVGVVWFFVHVILSTRNGAGTPLLTNILCMQSHVSTLIYIWLRCFSVSGGGSEILFRSGRLHVPDKWTKE